MCFYGKRSLILTPFFASLSVRAALMPGGDHLNIIDPPGLTVMRIAGGRYRVTAAHRVVWTWMNEFVALTDTTAKGDIINQEMNQLQVGDLVTMTIVDVFGTFGEVCWAPLVARRVSGCSRKVTSKDSPHSSRRNR